jgi:PAS domain S-box-containing protein
MKTNDSKDFQAESPDDASSRRPVNAALADSELRYRRLFETAKDGILILDAETGIVVDVNPFLVNLLGYPYENFVGKAIWELGFFRDIVANQDNFEELQQKEYIRYEDKPLKTSDGRQVDVEFVSNVYLVDHKKVIQCNIRNITEHKRAEEALRASRQITEEIINAIPVRVFWKDKNLVYLGCNTAFAHDAGFTDPKNIIGKDDYQMGWRDQAELYRADDRRVIESGCSKIFIEEPQTTPDGNTITLLTSKLPLRNSKGEISGVLGTYMDISEHKRATEALRESEERYRALYAESRDAIVMMSAEQAFLAGNPAAIKLFACQDEQDLVSRTTLSLSAEYQPDGMPSAAKILEMRNLALEKGSYFFEWTFHRADGVEFPATVLLSRVEIGSQQLLQATVRDDTEHLQLEAQFRQAQKMEAVGRLAGGVAHDFNNMLGVILGYTEMALEQADPAQRLFANLQEIQKAAERSASLTRQLLAFARKQTIAPKTLDLNDAVAEILKMLRQLIGEDIRLVWLPGADLHPVRIDPSQVDQLLANLCLNARDAIAGVGNITLETGNITVNAGYCAVHVEAIPGEYVFLAVSDDGQGMDKETLAHIFEPFFTTKEIGKGTGLGLATVYGIVKQNNGFVYAYSEPDMGTMFRIYLPQVAAEAAATAAADTAETPKGRKETILLVEDEDSLRTVYKLFLDDLGYNVLLAETPKEALELSARYPGDIHLLLTDVVMPGMNGRQLADRISAAKPNIKELFMSGYTADVMIERGVLEQNKAFISKPFTRDELARKVRSVLPDIGK